MDKGALRIAAIPLSRAAEGNDGSDVGLLELQFNALVRPAALVAPRSRFEVRLAGRWNHGLAIRELQQNREYHVLTRQNVTLHHQKPISSHVPVPDDLDALSLLLSRLSLDCTERVFMNHSPSTHHWRIPWHESQASAASSSAHKTQRRWQSGTPSTSALR